MFDLLERINDLDGLTNPKAGDIYEVESTDDNGDPISRKETRQLMKEDIIATGPVRDHINELRAYVEDVEAMAREKVSTISINGGTLQTPNAVHNVDLTLSGQNLPFLTGGTDSIRVVVDEVAAHVDAVELVAQGAIQKSAVLVETGGGSTHGRRTVMQKVAMTERTGDKITLSSYSADVEDPEGITAIETHIPLPTVTSDFAGIMPASDHLQINANAADIAALKGANKRFPVNEELPGTLTQEEVQEIWDTALKAYRGGGHPHFLRGKHA